MRKVPLICKLHFAKFTFFAFFLITIRFISQKIYIFAADFEKRHKITKKI